MADEDTNKTKLGRLAAMILSVAAVLGACATLIGNFGSLRDAWCTNIGTFCARKDVATPLNPNVEVLDNILRAANKEAFKFSTVKMDSGFVNRLTTPLSTQAFGYFVKQGYPPELLFWLLVDGFAVTLGDHTMSYSYYPPTNYGCDKFDPKHRCFVDWVYVVTFAGLTAERKKISTDGAADMFAGRFCLDPVLAEAALSSMSPELLQAAKKNLDIASAPLYASDARCGSTSWNPTAASIEDNSVAIGTVRLEIDLRTSAGVFNFLANQLNMQRKHLTPSRDAYIPPEKSYVADPIALWTQHDDPGLLTIVNVLERPCFVYAEFENSNYCVPMEASTTKKTFGVLTEIVSKLGQPSLWRSGN
jgi:hypothetical protein